MFGYGNGTGTGWQNHWLALALTVGVIGMLIIFGLKSSGDGEEVTTAPEVTQPAPATGAPGTKKPSSTKKPGTKKPSGTKKTDKPDKDKKDNKDDDEKKKKKKKKNKKKKKKSDDDKDTFANWGPAAPAAISSPTRLPMADAWV